MKILENAALCGFNILINFPSGCTVYLVIKCAGPGANSGLQSVGR